MIRAQEYPQMYDTCECGHQHYCHKGLGVKVEGAENPRIHVCLPITREVCECREYRKAKS